MKQAQRRAYNALKKIGVPVFERDDLEQHGTFGISAEENYDTLWADYYETAHLDNHYNYQFGVHPKITTILDKYDLHAEWDNPGCLSVWD